MDVPRSSMSDYQACRPRTDILEELRQKGDFSDFVFVAWGIIELGSNEGILGAYNLSSQEIRVRSESQTSGRSR
jgi:hypothetical protein